MEELIEGKALVRPPLNKAILEPNTIKSNRRSKYGRKRKYPKQG